MKTLSVIVVILTSVTWGQDAKPKTQPTGLVLAATWSHTLRAAKIDYAQKVLAEADYITYEMCVEDTPNGYWQPPTQPKNIRKCNLLIDHVEKLEAKEPKW